MDPVSADLTQNLRRIFVATLIQAFYNHLDVQNPAASDQAMVIAGLLSTRPAGKPRNDITFKSDQHSVITLAPEQSDQPAFDVVAVFDPVSKGELQQRICINSPLH